MVSKPIANAAWYFSQAWVSANVDASISPDQVAAVKGQFGDQFGAINSLFSGLAFAGIIITILLQRRDLNETISAMSHERFDNTFFQLLGVHIAIAEKISVLSQEGKKAFGAFNSILLSSDADFFVYASLRKLTRQEIRDICANGIVDRVTYPKLDDSDVTNISESLARAGVPQRRHYGDPA